MAKWLRAVTYLSLSWGILLNIAVVANLDFVRPLAAGGQFDTFPTAIRLIYSVQTFWLLYQTYVFYRLTKEFPIKPRWIVTIFIYLGLIGTLLNLVSQSNLERLNALPLAVVTYSFWKLRSKSLK
jgi:hypothetical protein